MCTRVEQASCINICIKQFLSNREEIVFNSSVMVAVVVVAPKVMVMVGGGATKDKTSGQEDGEEGGEVGEEEEEEQDQQTMVSCQVINTSRTRMTTIRLIDFLASGRIGLLEATVHSVTGKGLQIIRTHTAVTIEVVPGMVDMIALSRSLRLDN